MLIMPSLLFFETSVLVTLNPFMAAIIEFQPEPAPASKKSTFPSFLILSRNLLKGPAYILAPICQKGR